MSQDEPWTERVAHRLLVKQGDPCRTYWGERIALIERATSAPRKADIFFRLWMTASRPAHLQCDDGLEFVVKGSNAGRQTVNDQIVARLGSFMGAPVGQPGFVDVPAELIESQSEMKSEGFLPGLSHGSEFVGDCTEAERNAPMHSNLPENRERFALLAVLYGWVSSNDHQLLYRKQLPNLVFSVDHGHFFPGGPNWDENKLKSAPDPSVHDWFKSTCQFTDGEIKFAARRLAGVTDDQIAYAVGVVPDARGLTESERISLAIYLAERRAKLCTAMFGR